MHWCCCNNAIRLLIPAESLISWSVADFKIILYICSCSTGGNLLMNMGPNHDGRLMPIFQERMLQMGKIIDLAIYTLRDKKLHDIVVNCMFRRY